MPNTSDSNQRIFTLAELRRCDGERGPACVAFAGRVYDVSTCPHWRSGLHEGLHFPGQDLTAELVAAPHGVEVFQLAGVCCVGRLAD